MTDSGQAPKPPPDPQPPAVPDWAPTQAPGSAAPPAAPAPDPYAVEATMRLIPVQHVPPPATPAPPAPATPVPPPAEQASSAPSERRIGKYIIKGELGRGGMGAVYLAEKPGLRREGAIKELLASTGPEPPALPPLTHRAHVT